MGSRISNRTVTDSLRTRPTVNTLLLPLWPSTYDGTLSTLRRAAILAISTLLSGQVLLSCGGANTNSTSPAPVPTPAPLHVTSVSVYPNPDFTAGYQVGDRIYVQIWWSGDIGVSGAPLLIMRIGDNEKSVPLFDRSDSGVRFRYDVRHDDQDSDGLSVVRLDLNGASIVALDGQTPVNTDLGVHAIENHPAYKVRATGIVASGLRVTDVYFRGSPTDPATGYRTGDRIHFSVRWSGNIEVTGRPRLGIQIGSRQEYAQFDGIHNGSRLGDTNFLYVVGDDDYDVDGISVLGLDLNGASIVSLDGGVPVDLDLGSHAISNDPVHKVRAAAPVLRVTRVSITNTPSDTRIGYQEGARVWFDVLWDGEIEVDGWPRLAIEMGNERRYASYWDQYERSISFVYTVTYYDHDPDGVSVLADAIELNDGIIVAVDGGADVDTEMDDFVIRNSRLHRVRPNEPRADVRQCTVERREVRRHPAGFVLDEWNGQPFRVDIVRNFPSFVTDEDLEKLLEPIGIAADAIEDQLGYRILEKGGIVPVPSGMRPGWNRDYHGYARNPLPREPRQLLAFYMDDESSFWDHRGGSPAVAFTYTGTTSYNKRTMGPWWHDRDSCCIGRYSGNGRMGHGLLHEVFHLFGFEHPDVPFGTPGVRMAWGSLAAPWLSGSSVHFLAEKDIEVLRCIFPRR